MAVSPYSRLVQITMIIIFLAACGKKKQNAQQAIPVQEFAVAEIEPSDITLITSYPANIRGKQDIEVRPKVNGFITKINITDGAIVKKGQLLFQLDRVQYEEAVRAAEANVKVAEANLGTSQLTVNTRASLAEQNIISQFELETSQNQLESQRALLAQAQAQLTSARNDLSYTNITSPWDGIVGSIPYDVGSLVSTTIEPPLTVISDISEMYVYFSMNEKQLLELTRKDSVIQQTLDEMPDVQLQLADGSIYSEKGKIETLTGVIDENTGTVTLKAIFPNRDRYLRSGGTGNVLIPLYLRSVIVIPQKATSELQDKKFVYTITDSIVRRTPIDVLDQDDGKNYVVTEGLQAGQKIVIEGVIALRDSMKIKPITPQEAEARIRQQTQVKTDSVK